MACNQYKITVEDCLIKVTNLETGITKDYLGIAEEGSDYLRLISTCGCVSDRYDFRNIASPTLDDTPALAAFIESGLAGCAAGSASYCFFHDQPIASDQWVIVHGQNRSLCSHILKSVSGGMMIGNVYEFDLNTVHVDFSIPLSGSIKLVLGLC